MNEFKFYQDPLNPKLRQAVATIQFSFPVDPASLENNITLQWQALKNGKQDYSTQKFNYTITYDDNKRIAYLHSETIALPERERYLELTLKKGIKSLTGAAKLAENVTANVLIPNASSFFKITKVHHSHHTQSAR